MKETTFAMIKPDAFQRGYMGQIILTLEQNFVINQMVLATLLPQTVQKLYEEHEGKDFYQGLIEHSLSGPVVLFELEGDNAVAKLRNLIGPSDPAKAGKDTIRGQYGSGMPDNAIHGSDSAKTAKKELYLMFG